ncbi:MAG: LysM peptidoglycan-binding domain-containing protein [Deltaproteobacteria bacterium]|nr:MAG: LysM peptidoglycan-binding domain-containing protein [Deltaproteobacteria bacterium]
MNRITTGLSLFAALAALPAISAAQTAEPPRTLDPSGRRSSEPAPAAPAAAPGPQEGAPVAPGGDMAQPTEGQGDVGYYLYDESPIPEDEGLVRGGPAPELHVVREGDTLWDICQLYFDNPWEWPKVWSYNPAITNPHWIYPGDVVRLRPAAAEVMAAPVPDDVDAPAPAPAAAAPAPAPVRTVRLRQIAFLEPGQIATAFRIAGAEREREMLSPGDVVYLDYPGAERPESGARYGIYSDLRWIEHPRSGERLGAYVRVLGELEVVSVKPGKRARAVIRAANDVIERGARVGPVQQRFAAVAPTPASRDQTGVVVAQLGGGDLIGATQVVFIDLGEEDGVAAGNRAFVVRRGDARPDYFELAARPRDERYPPYAIGEVLVVQVGARVSIALVTASLQEIGVGDVVVLRSGR